MNKAQLTAAIAQRVNLDKQTVTALLDAFTATVTETVAKGEDVTLIGFGKFEQVHRSERDGRNVATGEPIRIPAKDVPRFVPGAAFKAAVAGVKETVAA